MSLASELLKIISNNPEAKKAIDSAVAKIVKGTFWARLFNVRPTKQERIDRIKSLLPELIKENFSNRFEDSLSFFGVLLGSVVESTLAVSRGCILEKFFLPDYHFYFPVPGREPSLGAYAGKNDPYYALEVERAKPPEPAKIYRFYAFKTSDDNGKALTTLTALRAKLDEIAKNPSLSGEETDFLNHLRSISVEPEYFNGIAQAKGTQTIYFRPALMTAHLPLVLKLNDSESTKATIVGDLKDVLKFVRV